ncbi:hypothetical protein QTP70_007647 [Hemibagrus guttatus]|uniref:Uncharacterized protein n=1 Tax=Hemibagrus guttatus TaxID=175788 RepID=A0AAE0REL2_9TELE|nr:hypothetical protein QTP70_007647 [Hemibagrus guttatus]
MEILKKDFRSLVEKVRSTSPMTRIIVSGPIPTFQPGIERMFSGSVLGSTVLMACTLAELEQQSSQTTSPGRYAPSDCSYANSSSLVSLLLPILRHLEIVPAPVDLQ